jgi:hypothetical protein
MWVFVESDGFGYDFRAYDDAARRLASGAPIYLPGTVEAYQAGRFEGLYLYPPPLALALVPLTILGQGDATTVWMVLRAGLLFAGCCVLPVSWPVRAAVLAVASVSFPVLLDLNLGNISLVVFALCAAAWRWQDSPVAAAAHAGLIALRLPFGLFALTWTVQGRWRMVAWTVTAGVLAILVVLPAVGFSPWAEYAAILRGLPDLSAGPHNFSLRSLALEVGLSETVASLALGLGYLLGLLAVGFAARRRAPGTAFVVSATATLLVSPFIHPHHLVLLLLPAAWLASRGQWWGLALPLAGWLPEQVLPLAAPMAIALVLAVREPRSSARLAPA